MPQTEIKFFPQLKSWGWAGKNKPPGHQNTGQAAPWRWEGWSPAVNHHRPRVRDALLLMVDLLQEVQHAPGVTGHSVVRPGPKVVLPDRSLRIPLE